MSRRARGRGGFTVVELLVVISIIAVLSTLIFVGVNKMRSRQTIDTAVTEIEEMSAALEKFKARYGLYPPSQLTLSVLVDAKGVSLLKSSAIQLEVDSFHILTRIFPNLDFPNAFGPNGMDITNGGKRTKLTIKGDQCLVLFLGGRQFIDSGSGQAVCQGFSDAVTVSGGNRLINPLAATGNRTTPMFQFKPTRLFRRDTTQPFFSYGDPWFKEVENANKRYPSYAYFTPVVGGRRSTTTASTREGQYDDTDNSTNLDNDVAANFPLAFRQPDPVKKDLANNPLPLTTQTGAFAPVNPDTFQIMSAGPDRLWGKAHVWAPGGKFDVFENQKAGIIERHESIDNLSNFANGQMQK